MIKNLLKVFSNLLINLYNKCLYFSHFPAPWKKGIVIFFRKKNKDIQPRAYRPITLLPMLGKDLERIIKIRTMTFLESTSYLNNAQYGFREARSTTDALLQLKKIIENSLISKKYSSLISFDIEGAFDTINWETISTIIDNSPLPNYIKNLLKNYISDRLNGLQHGSVFEWFQAFRGCPQGYCLGPLLWLLIADFLLKSFLQSSKDILTYADDFIVLAEGNTRTELEHDANNKIRIFNNLCQQLGLTISRDKTTAILFGRYLLENRNLIYKLEEKSISIKKNITHLGVVFD